MHKKAEVKENCSKDSMAPSVALSGECVLMGVHERERGREGGERVIE